MDKFNQYMQLINIIPCFMKYVNLFYNQRHITENTLTTFVLSVSLIIKSPTRWWPQFSTEPRLIFGRTAGSFYILDKAKNLMKKSQKPEKNL